MPPVVQRQGAKAQAVAILMEAARSIAYSGEANSKAKINTLYNASDYVLTGSFHGPRGVAASMRPPDDEFQISLFEEGKAE